MSLAKVSRVAQSTYTKVQEEIEDETNEHLDATFFCEGLPDITSLKAYVDWMKLIAKQTFPDSTYEVLSRCVNEKDEWMFFGVFKGTHLGAGGPVEPTGKSMTSQYVYVIKLEDGKIRSLTKIWNNLIAFKALGWA